MNRLIQASIAAMLGLSISACKTMDPYTGEEKVSNTAKFGAIGALVCGAIGSRKSGKRARNAAVGCGLIGMGIGAYMDEQEQQLRDELAGSGIRIAREGDNIRLIMPNSITFAVNQADISSSIHPTLNSVAKVLNEYDESILLVAGHTDSSGSDSYNQQLSYKRAMSVATYLKQQKVADVRLKIEGMGESNPIANNHTKEGQAQNRRVELLIEPKAAN